MIPYTYKCEECGHTEDFYYNMNEDRPKKKKCSKCQKMSMLRVFGDKKVHIPMHFQDDMPYEFNKSPSKKKHFW